MPVASGSDVTRITPTAPRTYRSRPGSGISRSVVDATEIQASLPLGSHAREPSPLRARHREHGARVVSGPEELVGLGLLGMRGDDRWGRAAGAAGRRAFRTEPAGPAGRASPVAGSPNPRQSPRREGQHGPGSRAIAFRRRAGAGDTSCSACGRRRRPCSRSARRWTAARAPRKDDLCPGRGAGVGPRPGAGGHRPRRSLGTRGLDESERSAPGPERRRHRAPRRPARRHGTREAGRTRVPRRTRTRSNRTESVARSGGHHGSPVVGVGASRGRGA
jgi:hypothetical protein